MQVFNRAQLILFSGLLVLLLLCGGVYASRSQTFTQPEGKELYFTNASLLRDWVPENTYAAIVNHIVYYASAQDITGTAFTVTTKPAFANNGAVSFSFKTEDGNTHKVNVSPSNYGGGAISYVVAIDGNEQDYMPLTNLSGSSFANFDQLTTDNGFSAAQAYEIETLLQQFSPNSTFELGIGSIKQKQVGENTISLFTVTINGKSYRVQNTSTGVSDVQISLTAIPSHGTVFSSQKIDLLD